MERTSQIGKPSHPFVAFFKALFRVTRNILRPALREARLAYTGFRYAYWRERGIEQTYRYIAPTPNPILDRMQEMGIDSDVPGETTQDIPILFLFRTEAGQLVSQTMINQGYLQGGHRLAAATTITDEEAVELLEVLEALSLETALKDEEKVLIEELRRMRDAKYAY